MLRLVLLVLVGWLAIDLAVVGWLIFVEWYARHGKSERPR